MDGRQGSTLVHDVMSVSGKESCKHDNSLLFPAAKLLQSCPILCNPIDSSPLGSTVPGILQARVLEWVAISFSRVIPDPRTTEKHTHFLLCEEFFKEKFVSSMKQSRIFPVRPDGENE